MAAIDCSLERNRADILRKIEEIEFTKAEFQYRSQTRAIKNERILNIVERPN